MRRLSFLILGIAAVAIGSAQSARICVHLEPLGPEYSETQTANLGPTAPDAPHYLRLDIRRDYGNSQAYAVKVSLYFGLETLGNVPGVNIINSFVRMDEPLKVYTDFVNDEAGYDNDDRKNANSHFAGDTEIDGAGNAPDYLDNSVFWWQRGGSIAGPAAFGKAMFVNDGFQSFEPTPMYSFVVLAPRREGRYRIYLDRLFSGGIPNVDETVKTNVLSLAEPNTVQFTLEQCDALIEVVPEPSSWLILCAALPLAKLASKRRVKR